MFVPDSWPEPSDPGSDQILAQLRGEVAFGWVRRGAAIEQSRWIYVEGGQLARLKRPMFAIPECPSGTA
jgi:hypothetical protein